MLELSLKNLNICCSPLFKQYMYDKAILFLQQFFFFFFLSEKMLLNPLVSELDYLFSLHVITFDSLVQVMF